MLKLDKFNEINDELSLSIYFIFVTLDVSISDKYKEISDEQWLKYFP